ncbi:MAG: DUF3795 domain-containing protein [FCB group bacterium]|nr:DUF3795 domain-containing protein [FCB group bacterium]
MNNDYPINEENMPEIIAKCGLLCNECEAYVATINDDHDEIARMAKEAAEKFGMQINPDDIYCEGCTTTSGRLSSYCLNSCEVRKCAVEKKVDNCAHCDDYSCEIIDNFIEQGLQIPEFQEKTFNAKQRLDHLHGNL